MPKGKRTPEKNLTKNRFTRNKESQARSSISTAPPAPLHIQVRPSSQNAMIVSPPKPPQNFIGGRFHNPWRSSSFYNYGASQPALTQAVQAAIPTIISAVETRIAGSVPSQGPAVETQIAVRGVSQSPEMEDFKLPQSYAAIAAKDAAAEQRQQFSKRRKKASVAAAAVIVVAAALTAAAAVIVVAASITAAAVLIAAACLKDAVVVK